MVPFLEKLLQILDNIDNINFGQLSFWHVQAIICTRPGDEERGLL